MLPEAKSMVEPLSASLFAAPASTLNGLLVPVIAELPPVPVAVMVKLPVLVMVTFWVRTPAVNGALVIGAPVSAPVEVSITLLPFASKLVTVLLPAS